MKLKISLFATMFFLVFSMSSFTEDEKTLELINSYSIKLNELKTRALTAYNTMGSLGSTDVFYKLEYNIKRFDGLAASIQSDSLKTLSSALGLVADEFSALALSYDSIADMSVAIGSQAKVLLDEMNKVTVEADTLAAEAAKEAEDLQEQITQITAQITLEQDDTEKRKLEVQKSSLESQYNSVKNTADLLAVFATKIKSYDTELGVFYNDLDVLLTALGENSNVYDKAADNIRVAETIATAFDDFNSLTDLNPMTDAIVDSWTTLDGLTDEITNFAITQAE